MCKLALNLIGARARPAGPTRRYSCAAGEGGNGGGWRHLKVNVILNLNWTFDRSPVGNKRLFS